MSLDPPDIARPDDDMLYVAWTIIANARDWHLDDRQAAEWRDAAERWRDRWHASITEPGPSVDVDRTDPT